MTIDNILIDKFSQLFAGFDRAHGTYGIEERKPNSPKTEIKRTASTPREAPTVEHYRRHLNGKRPLGIIPINRDSNCVWGCIDIDKYGESFSPKEVSQKITELKLPLIVCRSKSGGAHVFLFTKDPVPAAVMRDKLKEIAAGLGYGGSEIFPKQVYIDPDGAELGSWLNLPYFNAEDTNRYAVPPDERDGVPFHTFMLAAEKAKITGEELISLGVKKTKGPFEDGPPCLQFMAGMGVPEGGRNKALLNYAIYAKRKYQSSWRDQINEWNMQFFSPPLDLQEVLSTIKSVSSKDYHYTCRDEPICQFCNASACRARKYGIGKTAMPEISGLRKLLTIDPMWVMEIDNKTVRVPTTDLINLRAFRVAVAAQIDVLIPAIKETDWFELVQALLEKVQYIEAPEDMTAEGVVLDTFLEFTAGTHVEQGPERVTSRVWRNLEKEEYCFRMSNFVRFLRTRSSIKLDERHIVLIMKEKFSAKSDIRHIPKINTKRRLWCVPVSIVEENRIAEKQMFEFPGMVSKSNDSGVI